MQKIITIGMIFSGLVAAQTTDVNGGFRIFGELNASGAALTRPIRLATVTPSGVCSNSAELALFGSSLYGCVSSTWSQIGGVSGSGTVTSVGLAMPSLFSISGTPVTSSGTFAVSFQSQSPNLFLASPNGSAGVPLMRAILKVDLPAAMAATDQTNTYGAFLQHYGAARFIPPLGASLPASCTTGEVFFLTTATSGQNIYGCVATNTWLVQGDGGGGGGVTSLQGQTGALTFATPGTSGTAPAWSGLTLNIPLASSAGTTAGLLSKANFDTFNSKEPAITAGTVAQWWRGDKSFVTWPDCQNATSSKLLFNASTGAVTCGTDQNSGGGGTTDFPLTRTSATVLTVGLGTYAVGGTPYTIASATITLSGTPSGTVRIWAGTGGSYTPGTLYVGQSGTTGVTCSGCTVLTSVTSFPTASRVQQVAQWGFVSGAWDTTGTDRRAVVGGSGVTAIQTDATITSTQNSDGSVSLSAVGGGGGTSLIQPSGVGYFLIPGVVYDNFINDASTALRTYGFQFMVYSTMTINRATVEIVTGTGTTCSGTCAYRFGIFDAAGTTRVFDSGAITAGGSPVDANTTGYKDLVGTATVTIQPGVYWGVFTTNSTALQYRTPSSAGLAMGSLMRLNRSGGAGRLGYFQPSTGSGSTLNFPTSLGAFTALDFEQHFPLFIGWQQ